MGSLLIGSFFMKRIALIIIGHFKPEWNNLSEEEQAAFAARVGRTARKAGVTPIVGYKLTTQGSFLQIYEADAKPTLERFMGELDALGHKKYYDQALMLGERAENWIASEASPSEMRELEGAARGKENSRRPAQSPLAQTVETQSARKKAETQKRTR